MALSNFLDYALGVLTFATKWLVTVHCEPITDKGRLWCYPEYLYTVVSSVSSLITHPLVTFPFVRRSSQVKSLHTHIHTNHILKSCPTSTTLHHPPPPPPPPPSLNRSFSTLGTTHFYTQRMVFSFSLSHVTLTSCSQRQTPRHGDTGHPASIPVGGLYPYFANQGTAHVNSNVSCI